MSKLLRCLIFGLLFACLPSLAAAGELTVTIADGRATIIAKDVPVRQILAEWARVGNTRMVNAEKLTGGPVTIQLVDVPEKDALDILLRSAAGFVTAARETPSTGASLYDRVIILATSRPPAPTAAPPPPQPFNVNRPAIPQPMPPPQAAADDNNDDDQGPTPPAGLQNPGMPFPGPTVNPGGPTVINPPMNPGTVPPMNPGVPPPNTPPTTMSRPGMLPQPQPTPVNPYAPPGQPVGPNGRPLPQPGGRGGQND